MAPNLVLICVSVYLFAITTTIIVAEDPYRFFNWNVTYGDIYPLGVRQQGILINGQFPGPDIHSVTNDNLIINVFNSLDEPFLISWNGVQQRRNSYEDGVFGTTCPIPPGKNFTYILQVKDQIGSFYYFPSLAFHKAAGGFGGIRILSRPRIPVPFDDPAGDYTVLIGDWYKSNHTDLKAQLDNGKKLPFPDGILINGRGSGGSSLNVEQGKTYRLRISNVGLENSLNFRIQNHKMKLVEVEGTHTLQTTYSSLDVHVGQSYSVLVTADQPGQDYYIVVSSRFTNPVLTSTGILRYSNSAGPVSGPPPGGPTIQIDWSLNQARSIRTNLTASGPRPNPQGSYHYGMINLTRTIVLSSSAGQVNGKQRYAINSVSYVAPDTPLKLADFFKIAGVYRPGSISDRPSGGGIYLDTSVMQTDYRTFVEIVFQNDEDILQSYHLDGYSFFVVGMDGGQWTSDKRNQYNLRDAVSRSTTQVYPKSWTAIYVPLDNVGMWNLRSEFWARQYLGQQFYMRVYTTSTSLRDEYPIPKNALLCGRATGRHTRPCDLVTYKGPTMIASTLHSVALFLKRVGDWDWFVNLSASDYPLFSQDDLLHIFSFMPMDINFIEHTSNMGWKEFQRARPIIIDPGLYHSRVSSVYYAKERRSLPSSFKLFTGSEWVVLTKPFLEFCVYGWDNLPRTLLMYYTNFLSSNEGYFQTVLCNHKDYQNTTVNNDLRYLRWDNPPKQQPLSLKLEHFEDMAHSGAPFARRFDKDDPILDKIDRELLGRSDGRFTPGGWCLGNHLKGKNPCDVYGNPDVVNPSVRSKILEKLMLILLDSENFRPKQCK